MENVQPDMRGFEQTVLDLYVKRGEPINRVCELTGGSYLKVKNVLKKHEVDVRSRGIYTLRGADHPSSKLSHDQRQSLENELLAGHSHGPLARTYGLSRERVRQIAATIGAPSGRQLQLLRRAKRRRKKEEARRKRAEQRAKEREERYALWRRLWAEDLPIAEMAQRLGLKPGSVSVRIVNLRKQHPDWFPRRHGRRAAAVDRSPPEQSRS